MRDLIAASAITKRLREKMQAVTRTLVEDGDPQPLIDEAEADFQKLAAAMGYSVMKATDLSDRRPSK